MDGAAYISLVIDRWLSFGQTVTANSAAFRAWVLHCMQRRGNHVWLQPWPWTYQEALVSVRLAEISNPAAPTVSVQGTAGATAYAYKIVALLSDGLAHTAASAAGSTATGNATLTGSNFNRLTWTTVSGAASYDVYRTTGGAAPPKKIASATTALTLDDTGIAGTAVTPPTTNTTGNRASEIELPADYHSMTKDGHIYDESGSDLHWLPPLQLTRALRRLSTTLSTGTPTHYSEFLSVLDDDGNYIGGRRVIVYPQPTTATNLVMYYKTKAPTFVDGDDVTAVSNFEAIPSEHQESWFLDGVLADLLDKQGDARAASYEARYVKGLGEAYADENQGQNTPRRWGRRWGT